MITVAQIGARRHYAIPVMLERSGRLARVYTDLCAESLPMKLLAHTLPMQLRPPGLRRLLARTMPGVPRRKIRTFPGFTFQRLVAQSRKPGLNSYDQWLRANSEFCRRVVRRGFGDADCVYVFNGAGLEILQRARELGVRTILEQTDAPVEVEESLLEEERARWPDWEAAGATAQAWAPMAQRERREWDLADVILCGSEYVREGVRQAKGSAETCRVVPYGSNKKLDDAKRPWTADRRLRILFMGTLCLRKGVPYLLEAARYFRGKAEFRAVGPSQLTETAMAELANHVDVKDSVPRSDVDDHYSWADALVLPTISEGSANVCYEALAMGLPIITTPNAGSVVRDGVDGFVVPIRDSGAIVERIERLSCNPNLHSAMSQNALDRAKEYTWDAYRQRLLAAIEPAAEKTEVFGPKARVETLQLQQAPILE